MEEDIYAALGLPFISPELREGQGEIQRALKRKLPSLADAHSTDEIDHTHWGVKMARKGGVPKERVLNCLDLPRFAAFLTERLRRAANGQAARQASR